MVRYIVPLCLCVLVLSCGVQATSIAPLTFEQVVARAERIFVGRVVDVESFWDDRVIRTHVTFSLAETVKGRASLVVRLTFLGGSVGDTVFEVSGMPKFAVGEEHVIFSVEEDKIMNPIVGFWHGQVRVLRDGSAVRARVLRHNRTPFSRASALTQGMTLSEKASPMTLDQFLADIREVMKTQGGSR